MKFLKSHPFAVEAFFDSSIVLTFAVPKEDLESFVPKRLSLDTFEDKYAFIAVAIVDTKGLRPKGFPRFIGNNFHLIGYRIFVRYTDLEGKILRGLYIIKSETDKKRMEILGNIFTHYDYTSTDVAIFRKGSLEIVSSSKSAFYISIDNDRAKIEMPLGSPFTNWKDARRFAGPLPHTFACDNDGDSVLIIRGIRQNWKPRAINVIQYKISFLESLNLQNIILASAFKIENIPYYWEKGKVEKW